MELTEIEKNFLKVCADGLQGDGNSRFAKLICTGLESINELEAALKDERALISKLRAALRDYNPQRPSRPYDYIERIKAMLEEVQK